MVAMNLFGALWKVFKSGLLATNAVTILHRQRFLRKCECCLCCVCRRQEMSNSANCVFPPLCVQQ